MTYRCTTCEHKTENPDRDPDVIRYRGDYWHRGCAHVVGEVVFLPSLGKMTHSVSQDERGE